MSGPASSGFHRSRDGRHSDSGGVKRARATMLLHTGNVVMFSGRKHFMAMLHEYTKVAELMGIQAAEDIHFERLESLSHRKETQRCLRKLSEKEVQEWKERRAPFVLFEGCQAKFQQNADLKELLIQTDKMLLANTYDGDDLITTGSSAPSFKDWLRREHVTLELDWPDNMRQLNCLDFPLVHRGRNVLGFMLMELRTAFQREIINKIPIFSPAFLTNQYAYGAPAQIYVQPPTYHNPLQLSAPYHQARYWNYPQVYPPQPAIPMGQLPHMQPRPAVWAFPPPQLSQNVPNLLHGRLSYGAPPYIPFHSDEHMFHPGPHG